MSTTPSNPETGLGIEAAGIRTNWWVTSWQRPVPMSLCLCEPANLHPLKT